MRHHPRRMPTRGRHAVRELPEILDAPTWLQRYLTRHGPTVKVSSAVKYGCIAGFTPGELHKAAAKLAVEVYGEPGESARYWRLR